AAGRAAGRRILPCILPRVDGVRAGPADHWYSAPPPASNQHKGEDRVTAQNQTDKTKEQATQAREAAAEMGSQFKEGARDQAQKVADQTRQAWADIQQEPTPSGIQGVLENLPATTYL